MGRKSRFSGEVRERAVRLVGDHSSEYGSQREAIRSIAEKIECSADRNSGSRIVLVRPFLSPG
jgi:hypothetical protein